MKKNYFLAVSLLIAFAGCDNTEIDSIADNEQVAAEVSAGILSDEASVPFREGGGGFAFREGTLDGEFSGL